MGLHGSRPSAIVRRVVEQLHSWSWSAWFAALTVSATPACLAATTQQAPSEAASEAADSQSSTRTGANVEGSSAIQFSAPIMEFPVTEEPQPKDRRTLLREELLAAPDALIARLMAQDVKTPGLDIDAYLDDLVWTSRILNRMNAPHSDRLKSIPILQRYIELGSWEDPEDTFFYARAVRNLYTIYYDIGDLENAEKYYDVMLELFSSSNSYKDQLRYEADSLFWNYDEIRRPEKKLIVIEYLAAASRNKVPFGWRSEDYINRDLPINCHELRDFADSIMFQVKALIVDGKLAEAKSILHAAVYDGPSDCEILRLGPDHRTGGLNNARKNRGTVEKFLAGLPFSGSMPKPISLPEKNELVLEYQSLLRSMGDNKLADEILLIALNRRVSSRTELVRHGFSGAVIARAKKINSLSEYGEVIWLTYPGFSGQQSSEEDRDNFSNKEGSAAQYLLMGEYLEANPGVVAQKAKAIMFYKAAVNSIMPLFSKLSEISVEQKRLFFKSWGNLYTRLQGLLVSEGRFAEAEQAGRLMKGFEQVSFTRGFSSNGATEPMPFTAEERAWFVDLASQDDEISAARDHLMRIISMKGCARSPGERVVPIGSSRLPASEMEAHLQEQKQRMADNERRFEASGLLMGAGAGYRPCKAGPDFDDDYLKLIYNEANDAIMAQIQGSVGVWYAWLKQPRKVEPASANEQGSVTPAPDEALPLGTASLQIWASDSKANIILRSGTETTFKAVDLQTSDLNELIFGTRREMRRGGDEFIEFDPKHMTELKSRLGALYDVLIRPIEAELVAREVKLIVFDLQGSLRYLPMAALWDGEHWLVEKYGIAYRSSLSPRAAEQELPAFTGQGFGTSEAVSGFAALLAVPDELEAILTGNDGNGEIAGSVVLNGGFNAKALKASLTDPKPVLHIASHFAVVPGNDAQSFLLLGDGTHLTLSELNRNPEYAMSGIELVALSACETAIGAEGTGVEVEGMATTVLNRGARTVLASLWSVDDEATRQLMTHFYSNLVTNPAKRAEALRGAQIKMLTAEGYSDPFFWAPFNVIGAWE